MHFNHNNISIVWTKKFHFSAIHHFETLPDQQSQRHLITNNTIMRSIILLIVVVCLVQFLHAQCQTKPSATGADCTFATSCLSTICNEKKCSAINLVAKGAECDGDVLCFAGGMLCGKRQKICGAGLYCKGYKTNGITETAGTCDSIPKIGEACSTDNVLPCIGSFCANNTKVCTPYRSLSSGAVCSASNECKANWKCQDKVCAAAGKEGEACKESLGCESNLACAESKCVKPLAAGAVCDEYVIINYF